LKERRTARRYKLVLQVQIKPEADRKEFEPIMGRTRNISTNGFFFRMGQKLSVGTKIGFSIMPPPELTQAEHAFITGRARVTRIEEVSENNGDHVGIGAVIEAYKFGQTESENLT